MWELDDKNADYAMENLVPVSTVTLMFITFSP